MKIVINGYNFENAEWEANAGVGRMSFPSDESIPGIIEKIGDASNIEIYDDHDILISVWYNTGILNIAEAKDYEGKRFIEIAFTVSILASNAEGVLQEYIDMSVDGIMDLADYISEIDTNHTETRRRIDMYTESVQDIARNFDQKYDDTNEKFATQEKEIGGIVEELSKLQVQMSKIGGMVDGIPKDLVKKLSAIWEVINAIADQIAIIENKQ